MGEHELIMRYGQDTTSVFLELMERHPDDDPVSAEIMLDIAVLTTKTSKGNGYREPILKGFPERKPRA